MNSNNGFALLIVLIMLQIITLLGYCMLQTTWMETKISQYFFTKSRLNEKAENALHIAELQTLHMLPACIVPVTTTQKFLSLPLSWWQTFACHGQLKQFNYFYVVEFLGKNLCATTDDASSINYYRITVLTTYSEAKVILQSTLIKSGEALDPVCQKPLRQVALGRQMWRDLNNDKPLE